MIDLSVREYEILNYIYKNNSVSLDNLKARFPEEASIELRIRGFGRTAARPALIEPLFESKFNGEETVSVPTQTYKLSEIGKSALQDYKAANKIYKKELWLKNAWIPIIVSLTTTALSHHILPWLWQILKSAIYTLL